MTGNATCWLVMRGWAVAIYRQFRKASEQLFAGTASARVPRLPPVPDPTRPTAVLVIEDRVGAGLEVLSWVQRAYPGHFVNIVFLGIATAAVHGDEDRNGTCALPGNLELSLRRCVDHCRRQGLAAEYRLVCAADPLPEFHALMRRIMQEYPQAMCFAGDPAVAGAGGGGLLWG